jgi:hypothetical protein
LCEAFVPLVILRQANQVVHEVLQLVLAVLVLPLQGQSAVFASEVLQVNFGVCLRKVKQSECVTILHLLMVDSSLIEEAEGAALGLEGAIVVAIRARSFSKSLVNLFCLGQATKTLLVIFSVDVTESQHVVDNDEVLIESLRFLGREVGERGEGKLVALEGVAKLLDVVVELA